MPYAFSKLNVLVVDDNRHMRQLLRTVLRAFGVYNVYEAENTDEAWERIGLYKIDIVLLDWVLEGAPGIEFARRVRTLPESLNALVPIIMVSGHTSVEHVTAARDAGINEFLAKPMSPAGLFARLVSVIEHPRSFVRTKRYFGPCRRRHYGAYGGEERRGVTNV